MGVKAVDFLFQRLFFSSAEGGNKNRYESLKHGGRCHQPQAQPAAGAGCLRLGGLHPALARAPLCGACDSGCGSCAKSAAPAPSAQPTRRVIPIAVDRRAE